MTKGGIIAALILSCVAARAQQSELDRFALDSQLEQQVVSSTKTEQRGAVTPAVITVITADEIQQRGYSSLADVLRAVPGFYDVYDLVYHNIGVRGINGGARASGNVIKLMIDGHPVDYRPSTGNLFGEELIPIYAIERVEIIRGPASALYGGNAFLGVVNVILKSGEAVNGVRLVGQGALVRDHIGGGGGFLMGGSNGNVDVVAGAHYLWTDRSGRGLPDTSPLPAAELADIRARGPSTLDRHRPKTIFGRMTLNGVAWGKLTFLATVQNLDSRGEFQDFGPLSHGTRLAAVNQNYRLMYEITPHEKFTLRVSGHYFNAAPSGKERLDIARPDFILVRRVGADGFGFNAEGRVRAHPMFNLTVGADFVQEEHVLQTFDVQYTTPLLNPDGSVLIKAGSTTPQAAPSARSTFRNVGGFVQGILALKYDLNITAGARLDYHNIYGANFSSRAGFVWAPASRPISLKLLYGSSFKAPSAEQLYTDPMKLLDIRGNPTLQAQTAHTVELFGGFRLPKDRGEVSVNLYATDVLRRVEYYTSGRYQQAQNIDEEWVLGGEIDSRFVLLKPLHLRFLAGVARTVAKRLGRSVPPGTPDVINPLYPPYQFHLFLDYQSPWWGLRGSIELSWIGPRGASQSNTLLRGMQYELPGYPYLAVTISTAGRKIIPGRETNLALRISNMINYGYVEPGFSGIDVPAQGITAYLMVNQQL